MVYLLVIGIFFYIFQATLPADSAWEARGGRGRRIWIELISSFNYPPETNEVSRRFTATAK